MVGSGSVRFSTAMGRQRVKPRANTYESNIRRLIALVSTRIIVQEARSGLGRENEATRRPSMATSSGGRSVTRQRSLPRRYRRLGGMSLRALDPGAGGVVAVILAVACALWTSSLVAQAPSGASAAGYHPVYGYDPAYGYTTQYPPGYTTQDPTTIESTGGETTSIGCEPDPVDPVTEGTVKVGDLDCDGDIDEGDRRAADLNRDGVVNAADDHTGDGVVDRADYELRRYAVQAAAAAEEALDGGAVYAEAEEEAFGAAVDAGASPEQASTVAQTQTAQAMGGVVLDTARGAMPVGIFRYDLPEEVRLGETAAVEALVSPKVGEEFRRIGREEGQRRGVTIEVSDRMAARLIGINFDKEPDDTQIQALGSMRPARWSWQVSPKKAGSQELLLEITARITVQGRDTDLGVASSRQEVVVTNPLGQRFSRFLGAYWEWLWVAVLAPVVGAMWRWYQRRNDRRSEDFTVESFAGRLGETFRVHAGASGPLDLELISASALGESSGRPFSIMFRGPGDVVLPRRIYRLENAGMGAFKVFLVPIGRDEAGMRYEAVFN